MIPEDVWSWDEARTHREIADLLPQGWSFACTQNRESFLWDARYTGPEGEVVWEESEVSPNLALFSAYGWIVARVRAMAPPSKRASPWTRRRDLSTAQVRQDASKLADPPDLDPSEVESVYDRHRHK